MFATIATAAALALTLATAPAAPAYATPAEAYAAQLAEGASASRPGREHDACGYACDPEWWEQVAEPALDECWAACDPDTYAAVERALTDLYVAYGPAEPWDAWDRAFERMLAHGTPEQADAYDLWVYPAYECALC